jgi:peroxiredoxin Q/BCP
MKRTILTLAAGLLAAASLAPSLNAADKAVKPLPQLKVGDQAPDFKLQYFDGTKEQEVTLSQYSGKQNVIVAFYIFAFTGG